MRDEICARRGEELVLDGFFPRVDARRRAASKPCAPASRSSACPTRPIRRSRATLARVLAAARRAPDGDLVERRRAQVGGDPRAHPRGADGAGSARTPRVLENAAPDLAVARGAAYYGLARSAPAPRHCRSAAARRARSTSASTPRRCTPGQVTVMCLTPRGFEEGAEVTLSEHALELLTNRPVRFRLFSSSDRVGDRAGQLLTLPRRRARRAAADVHGAALPRSSHEAALSVNLRARLTEIGTLELECVARATGNEQEDRWKLQFDLRVSEDASGQAAERVAGADDAERRRAAEDRAGHRGLARALRQGRRRPSIRRASMKAAASRPRSARRLVVHRSARAVGAAQGSARRARQVGGARGALVQPRRLRAASRASAIRSTTGASRRHGACSTPASFTTRTIPASSSGGSCGAASRAA